VIGGCLSSVGFLIAEPADFVDCGRVLFGSFLIVGGLYSVTAPKYLFSIQRSLFSSHAQYR